MSPYHRSTAIIVPDVEVCPRLVEMLDNVSMSPVDCQHHRSNTFIVLDVDVRPHLVKILDNVSMSHPGCHHHRSPPLIVPDVHIRASLHQPDLLVLTMPGSMVQPGPATKIRHRCFTFDLL